MEASLSVLNTLVIVLLPTIVAGVATIIWRTAAMEGKIEKVLREHEAKAH